MIDYIIFEGANGTSLNVDQDFYPLSLFDFQYDTRNDQTDKVQQHGQWQTFDYLGRMHLHIEGNVMGNSAFDYWQKRMALSQIFNPVPELGFRYTVNVRVKFTGIGEECSALFNLDGRIDMPLNNQFPANSPFQLSLTAPDPRMYGTEQSFQAGQPIASGGLVYPLIYPLSYGSQNTGGDAFINNAGNANTFANVVINGPVSGPTLTLDNADGTQSTLGFSNNGGLHIADGDFVIVNMGAKTVTSSIGHNLFSYATGTWWFLQPGINHVRFNGLDTSSDTSASFQWSNAYLF